MRVRNNSGWDKRRLRAILDSSSIPSALFSQFILFLILFSQVLPATALDPASLKVSDSSINPASDSPINPVSDSPINPVSIVILDGEEVYVQSGDYHSFYQNYRLYVKGANAEDKRVWLELCLENESLENLIATEGSNLIYKKDSTEILNITVDTIYAGTGGVLVKFSPVFQYLDLQLPRPVESNDQNPLYPLTPDQPLDVENKTNEVRGFGSSLSLMVFLTVVLITGFFTGNCRKK